MTKRVRQLYLGASPRYMKKVDLIENVAEERRAFGAKTLSREALSVASMAWLSA